MFLRTFLFSIAGVLLHGPLLDDADYILGTGKDTQITVGAPLGKVTAIWNIGTAVALYPLARRYTPPAPLGYVTLRVVESVMIVAGVVSILGVLTCASVRRRRRSRLAAFGLSTGTFC